jgi:hypothetical protein
LRAYGTILQRESFGKGPDTYAVKYDPITREITKVRSGGERGTEILVVAHTATEGIDLETADPAIDSGRKRSWRDIMADDNDPRFIIEVDGGQFDTRRPIDTDLLQAIAAANPEIDKEWVWRTGEGDRVDQEGNAPISELTNGQVSLEWAQRSASDKEFRFRPAVVLA